MFGSSQVDEGPSTPTTAIKIAAEKGHLDILKLLLEAGEDGSQFISEYPYSLRLAYRSGQRAIAQYLQSYRHITFGHLSCDIDEEILVGIEDKRRDMKYWFKFREDERYSEWGLVLAGLDDPGAWSIISELSDNMLTGSNDNSFNGCDNSLNTSGNASKGKDGISSVDTNLLGVSNEENKVLRGENADGKTKFGNDLTDLEWQELFDFDVDQSDPRTDHRSCVMPTSMEVLAERTPIEPFRQPMGSNVLPQFVSSEETDASQIVAESSEWMNVLDDDTILAPWGQMETKIPWQT